MIHLDGRGRSRRVQSGQQAARGRRARHHGAAVGRRRPASDRRARGHVRPSTTCLFSPNGTRCAAGSDDRDQALVRIWSVPDGKLVRDLEGHRGDVGAAFSGDGERLATWDNYDHAMSVGRAIASPSRPTSSSAPIIPGRRDPIRSGAWLLSAPANGELDVLRPDGTGRRRTQALIAKAIRSDRDLTRWCDDRDCERRRDRGAVGRWLSALARDARRQHRAHHGRAVFTRRQGRRHRVL